MSKTVAQILDEHDIDIKDCRDHSFYNTPNVSGKYRVFKH